MHSPQPLIAGVLLLLSLGCSGALTGPAPEGRFVLQSIDGDPVPAVWVAHAAGVTEILADTLWLDTASRGSRSVIYRSTEAGGTPNTYRAEESFTHTRVDGRIEISIDCRDVIVRTASCVAPPHMVGRIDEADALVVEAFNGRRMRYRRI